MCSTGPCQIFPEASLAKAMYELYAFEVITAGVIKWNALSDEDLHINHEEQSAPTP